MSIRTVTSKGRSLFSNHNYKAGEAALKETAICAVLNNNDNTHCIHCFTAIQPSLNLINKKLKLNNTKTIDNNNTLLKWQDKKKNVQQHIKNSNVKDVWKEINDEYKDYKIKKKELKEKEKQYNNEISLACYCSTCRNTTVSSSQKLLDKCDLNVLHEGTSSKRRFPRLIAQLVAQSISSTDLSLQSFWSNILTLAAPQNSAEYAEGLSDDYTNLQNFFEPVMDKETQQVIFGSALTLEWYARIEGILHVNAIGLNPLPSLEDSQRINDDHPFTFDVKEDVGVGLFVQSSMLNHSCEPSLVMYRDPMVDGVGVIFKATKDIAKDEEMTISYLSNPFNMERQTRQDELKYKYGFECKCVLCQKQKK